MDTKIKQLMDTKIKLLVFPLKNFLLNLMPSSFQIKTIHNKIMVTQKCKS